MNVGFKLISRIFVNRLPQFFTRLWALIGAVSMPNFVYLLSFISEIMGKNFKALPFKLRTR